jgi:hypothetical protein
MLHNNTELGCYHCHPEHRGTDAPLTLMDSGTFPHEVVGFFLTGHQFTAARKPFTCDDCHQGDVATFTLDTCDSCHRDMDLAFMTAHTLSFGSACLDCHDGVDRLGKKFDHNVFSFELTGKHTRVACVQCHINARALTDFTTTAQDCYSCHYQDDAHQGQYGTECSACHTPSDWEAVNFDHSRSNFPLTGAHAGVACENCHASGQFSGLSTECSTCHEDPVFHAGMFGSDCGSCHTTGNWSASYDGPHPAIADEGGSGVNHGGASCRDCHTQTLQAATCTKCHEGNPEGGEGEGHD